MHYDAIIFDLDGTIINTEHLWQQATMELILNHHKPYTKSLQSQLAHDLRGKFLGPSIEHVKKLTGIDVDSAILGREKLAIFTRLLAGSVEFIPGFVAFYEKIQGKGLKLAIATNSDDICVLNVTQSLHLDKYFQSHIYHVQHVNGIGKPSPDIYLHAAKQLGVEPSRCLVIEDSATGISAGLAAGMTVIGINTGKNLEQLKKAHHIVETYGAIDVETIIG
ncbi:MAG: HAD family phosphatase [Parachlamydiales bacterium]|nr:HAD family phosphatase [Parachlamydiales bacterium]